MKYACIFISLFLTWQTAEARFDFMPGSRYTSVRAYGMADAYMPLVDEGGEALFYQPASLSAIEKTGFQGINLALKGNMPFWSTIGTGSLGVFSFSSYAPTLAANPNRLAGFGFATLPSFSFRGFSIGLLFQMDQRAQFNGSSYNYQAQYYFIPAAGFGIPLARGIVRLGYSLQWVHKADGIATTAVPTSYTDGIPRGQGFSHTAGATLALPYPSTPTFNFVFRNLFNTVYSAGEILPQATGTASGLPGEDLMSVDATFSLHPHFGSGRSSFVLQYTDLFNSTQATILWHLGIGGEFAVRENFFVRGGWRSLMPYVGFSYRSSSFEFTMAYASENTGNIGAFVRDEQFWLQLKFGTN